jgi:hypothetical protein
MHEKLLQAKEAKSLGCWSSFADARGRAWVEGVRSTRVGTVATEQDSTWQCCAIRVSGYGVTQLLIALRRSVVVLMD